ncbi:MAG: glutaredoxin 3 [Gammaproteobacteria bacterium]
MKKIIIYKAPNCPYCVQAAALLKSKGLAFQEIDISSSDTLRDEMIQKTQRRTVPQIFIGDYHVGGYSDLAQLESKGQLDPLLK